jgi:hypothetical protein
MLGQRLELGVAQELIPALTHPDDLTAARF